MRLRGACGDLLGLDIVGYQFPEPLRAETDGWDENWLVVAATMRFRGRTWSAADPFLATHEVERLAEWLRETARGEPSERMLFFLEPNLELEYVGSPSDGVSIRAAVGWELRPDPAPKTAGGQVFLTLDGLSRGDLIDAADSLEDQLTEYPPRGLWRSRWYGRNEPRT